MHVLFPSLHLQMIKFGETVRIGYVYNLAILNFVEFRITLPRARDPSAAFFPISALSLAV